MSIISVPAEVAIAAQGLIALFGPNLVPIGKFKDQDVYRFLFPDNDETGFPYVYLYDGKKAQEVTGLDALDIIASLGVE